jgi:glycosyltransferase involved in cell wall biosynthesis/predicted O-methyltransferase YrrM
MPPAPVDAPYLSAVICTYDRADMLRLTLESLCGQTLDQKAFEVVVVDDGSKDHTREVAHLFEARLPLRYSHQRNAGLASARNHGLFLSRGEVLLFLDDDDIADPGLLEAHCATHRRFPDPRYGVLGYTALEPTVARDPLMHFVTEVGCFLFSYPAIADGAVLDFSHFWGGRSSCKRAFLLRHGVFNPVFRFGCEDIELAFRLSRHGFQVVHDRRAVSTMVRRIGFDAFCQRLVRQGQSNFVFSRLHQEPAVQRWAEVAEAEATWRELGGRYDAVLRSGRELDRIVRLRLEAGLPVDAADTSLLHRAYWQALRASKAKGIVEKAKEMGQELAREPRPARPDASSAPTPQPLSYSSADLASFLGGVPGIHADGTITWGLSEDTLRFLDAKVSASSKTLETGAGVSTLLFAFKGAWHTCITPFADEIDRLRGYGRRHGVGMERVSFVLEKSQYALPALRDARDLDLVLIDGGHGFPVPFLDWFLAAPLLKVGGIVVVDDTQLWTGEVLRDFLAAEPEWRLEARFVRGAAFRKISDRVEKEWNEQPFVFERSESPGHPRKGGG